jgi:hypothetical protein
MYVVSTPIPDSRMPDLKDGGEELTLGSEPSLPFRAVYR